MMFYTPNGGWVKLLGFDWGSERSMCGVACLRCP